MLPAFVGALCAACSKPAPPPDTAPTVEVATPLSERVADWDDYSGRFEPVDSVEVRPRVSGAIQSVNFDDGQVVKQGELLFVIDPRPYAAQLAHAKAQLAGARAQLANADAELKRAEALVKSKLVSEADAEVRMAAQLQAAADLAAAEATVQTQELNLSFTRVTAPIAGRASYRRLAVGNIVTADTTPLTTIVTQDPIRFVFDAPESALLKYKRESGGALSSPVEIRLQDETEYRWKGRVDFLDNSLDRSSGTIRLRAVVDNPDGFISPGMFGQMRLFATKPFDTLLVPDQSIVTDQTRQVVYVVDAAGRHRPEGRAPRATDGRAPRDPRRSRSARPDRDQRRAARAARTQSHGEGRRGERVPDRRVARREQHACRCRLRAASGFERARRSSERRLARAGQRQPLSRAERCASRTSSSTGRSSRPPCRSSSR